MPYVICKHSLFLCCVRTFSKYYVSTFSFLSRVLPTSSLYEKMATVSTVSESSSRLTPTVFERFQRLASHFKDFLFYIARNVENWFYDSLKLLLTPTDVQ